MKKATAVLFITLVATTAEAGDCRRISSVCIDSTPSKVISGITVTVDQVGGCWEYEDTYTCLKPEAVNYCEPFIRAGCWQTGSQCVAMDTMFNTGCMRYLQTWRCNDPSMPTPGNTIRLSDTYTLVSSDYDTSPCQSLDNNANCTLAESRCVSTTPPASLPPGIDPARVAPDGCYQKQNTYACLTGRLDTSECDAYSSNPNCSLQSTVCHERSNGQCIDEQKTFRCLARPPQTRTVTDCSGQLFCSDGKCFDTGYPADPDFARAMALMEAAREAGVYGSEASIFSGVDSRCRIKLFGLANCCKKSSKGAGYSNHLLYNVAAQVGANVLSYGSRYVYDALFTTQNPGWIQRGIASMMSIDPMQSALSQWSPSFSLYGFTVSTGTIAPGFLANQLGIGVVNLGSFAGLNFAFDPTTLAIQIAIMVIQDLLSCEQPEQILAMRRGLNLCHEVGSYCSKKVLRICVERTRSYCCYNSRLARIINEQGRAQLGKGWGSPKSPNCSGFTQGEFAAIDFSRLDLSEFMEEVMASIRLPDVQGMTQNVQGVVQHKVQNYYQRGSQ